MGLDYTCIGGPLHGKRWYAEATYFQVPVALPSISIRSEPTFEETISFEVFRYRLERFGAHRVWVPNDVQDPNKFVLELALKEDAP